MTSVVWIYDTLEKNNNLGIEYDSQIIRRRIVGLLIILSHWNSQQKMLWEEMHQK